MQETPPSLYHINMCLSIHFCISYPIERTLVRGSRESLQGEESDLRALRHTHGEPASAMHTRSGGSVGGVSRVSRAHRVEGLGV